MQIAILRETENVLIFCDLNDKKEIIWIIGSSSIAKESIHTQNRPIGLNLGFNEKDYKLVWAGMSSMSSYCVFFLNTTLNLCFNIFLVSSIAFRSSEYLQDNLGKILENIMLLPGSI
jgi:hypothetical protein